MNKQHIEASQRLSELEWFKNSKDVLVQSEHLTEEIQPAERCETDTNIVAYISGDLLYKDDVQYYGSWICTNDAFKFLQRCGWVDPFEQTLSDFIHYAWESGVDETGIHHENILDDLDKIKEAIKSGDLELSFILAIILIHEIAPELYAKGINPLLTTKEIK